jgi:hypothetical protein
MRRSLIVLLFCCGAAAADGTEFGGHTKVRVLGQAFPANSLLRELAGPESIDIEGDLRLNFSARHGRWSFETAYQLFALHGDSIEWTRDLGNAAGLFIARLPNDERRLFNLTDVLHDKGRNALVHRIDRLAVGYTSEKAVLRFGRQALSWGNGLFYSPMDLVNPFDPAAIDTEFKSGDDMLYGQYLRDNGDDLQAAVVFRRDVNTGDVEAESGTSALKYHGFAGNSEFDLLVASSYGDAVLGVGGLRSIGGAVWRSDVVVAATDDDTVLQFVTNLSYSWTWSGRNVSGAVEYYFNGFGQQNGNYDPASLAANPDLLERLARRELYAVGRNYLAGSLMIEMSPLWLLTPTLLANVDDPSALLQLVTQYSLSDNMTFLGSVNVPIGYDGSEFGGIDSGLGDTYLSTGVGIFAQLAWYF